MSRFVPTGRQIVLLARIADHIALPLTVLESGDVATDIAASIDLIELAKGGLIIYTLGDLAVRCTPSGRVWVRAHQSWPAWSSCERLESGH